MVAEQERREPITVKEWEYAAWCAMSPDGRMIALSRDRNTTISFRWSGERFRRLGEEGEGRRVEIWETGTWKLLDSYPSSGMMAPQVSFFKDSSAALVQFKDPFKDRVDWVLLRPGRPPEILRRETSSIRSAEVSVFSAYDERVLLAAIGLFGKVGNLRICHAGFSNREVLQCEPWLPEGVGEPGVHPWEITRFAVDRESVLNGYGKIAVFRRTRDLKVVWARTLEGNVRIGQACVSARGEYVALLQEAPVIGAEQTWTILVLDGKTGKTLRELPSLRPVVNGAGQRQIAISSDGRMLATSEETLITSPTPMNEQTVHLVDIASGEERALLAHGRVEMRKGVLDYGFFPEGLQFSPDGRYLFTCGRHTKAWDLAPEGKGNTPAKRAGR